MDKRVEHCLKNKCRDCQLYYKRTHLQKCRSYIIWVFDEDGYQYMRNYYIFNKSYLESIIYNNK